MLTSYTHVIKTLVCTQKMYLEVALQSKATYQRRLAKHAFMYRLQSTARFYQSQVAAVNANFTGLSEYMRDLALREIKIEDDTIQALAHDRMVLMKQAVSAQEQWALIQHLQEVTEEYKCQDLVEACVDQNAWRNHIKMLIVENSDVSLIDERLTMMRSYNHDLNGKLNSALMKLKTGDPDSYLADIRHKHYVTLFMTSTYGTWQHLWHLFRVLREENPVHMNTKMKNLMLEACLTPAHQGLLHKTLFGENSTTSPPDIYTYKKMEQTARVWNEDAAFLDALGDKAKAAISARSPEEMHKVEQVFRKPDSDDAALEKQRIKTIKRLLTMGPEGYQATWQLYERLKKGKRR